MYGVLPNIFCRHESQNTVTPYFSFLINYDELDEEIFSIFKSDAKMKKAIDQF